MSRSPVIGAQDAWRMARVVKALAKTALRLKRAGFEDQARRLATAAQLVAEVDAELIATFEASTE
jgi:hypothetical protein